MVVRSGFEVQLVDAKTKAPFKEHVKDGKIFVEAEPDAEYYIAARRVSLDRHSVVLSYYKVDDKCLGYRMSHKSISDRPNYEGIWSRTDGKEENIALRFSKACPTVNDQGFSGNIGKVEVILYEGVQEGTKPITDVASTFEPTVDVNKANSRACEKKCLLSTMGTTAVQTALKGSKMIKYTKGVLFDCITLHYCSALGMIEAGVLPKPDLWTLACMKRPAPAGQMTAPFKKMKFREKKGDEATQDVIVLEKVIEFVDLTDEDALPLFTW